MTVLGLLVVVAMLIGGSIVLMQGRKDAWSTANDAAEGLRLSLDRDIARNLRLVDQSLQGVIRALATPGIDDVPLGVRRQALFNSAAAAETLGDLRVIDAEGRTVEDSASPLSNDGEIGEAFRIHQERADAGLQISRASRSRTVAGDERLYLTRRIPTQDGHFVGVVEGSVGPGFFRHLFEHYNLGPRGTVSLVRDDGQVLYRYPHPEDQGGLDPIGSDDLRRFAEQDHGSFLSKSQADGRERLYEFGRVSGFPVILVFGRPTDDIYAAWWRRALIGAPFRLILCASAVASTLLFRREIRRRRTAEALLRVAVDELAALARTDGLTGIANRRAFDVVLDDEWRRTIRARAPIAVLAIDVDHFKSFNDRYGHLQGDQALRVVATCMRAVARRPGDVSARTGGEEFGMVLPDTDLAGALGLAERIRSSVEELDLRHEGSAFGRLTVSIGVAVSLPKRGDICQDLLESADAALYTAKRAGRNRVCSPDPAPPICADPPLSPIGT